METQYFPVNTNESEINDKEKTVSWISFLRQLFVCSTLAISYFLCGLGIGSPTVAIPQMRRENNSTGYINEEMASWMTAANYLAAVICLPLPALLSAWIGRKRTATFVSLTALIYFIVFYFSPTPTYFLIAQIISGMIIGSQLTLNLACVIEYSSPRYRGLFVTLKSASINWGIWVSNAVGTYWHWTNIGLIGIIVSLYTFVCVFFWPESPSWLAGNGDIDGCSKAHRWLKGTDEMSERELKTLLDTQIKNKEIQSKASEEKFGNMRHFLTTIFSKGYLKAIAVSMTIMSLNPCCGKLVSALYAIDIIKKITNDEATAYRDMLILDGVSVFSMYFGSIMSRYLRRRLMLFTFATIGIAFLYIISFYLYLIKLSVISEHNLVSLALLIGYSIAISCGPMIMTTSIHAEIAPLRYRGFFLVFSGIFFNLIHFVFNKSSPAIFRNFGLHGTYFLFAILSSCLTFTLYKYMPETKDKNFKEIESYFVNGKDEKVMY